MPNKNYIKGRQAEYRLMKTLRDSGAIVMRSSGSHGLFDVIAIFPNANLIQMYQVKSGASYNYTSKKAEQELRDLGLSESQKFNVEFIVL